MKRSEPLLEEEMREPVIALFPTDSYWTLEQIPLGRKRIDLIFVKQSSPNLIVSVELKISDWRKALWQAAVNRQLADRSYVAIWHEYIHRAQRECELLKSYGVGLIVVYRESAEIIFEPACQARRISRLDKCEWYNRLMVPAETEACK